MPACRSGSSWRWRHWMRSLGSRVRCEGHCDFCRDRICLVMAGSLCDRWPIGSSFQHSRTKVGFCVAVGVPSSWLQALPSGSSCPSWSRRPKGTYLGATHEIPTRPATEPPCRYPNNPSPRRNLSRNRWLLYFHRNAGWQKCASASCRSTQRNYAGYRGSLPCFSTDQCLSVAMFLAHVNSPEASDRSHRQRSAVGPCRPGKD